MVMQDTDENDRLDEQDELLSRDEYEVELERQEGE